MKEIYTYQDLLNYLTTLSPGQLTHTVQIVEPSPFPKKTMLPGIAIGTAAEMELEGMRSVADNRYHGEEVVILADGNPFGEDGARMYEMLPDRTLKPIYEISGPTPEKDQWAPDCQEEDEDVTAAERVVLKNRMKDPPCE